MLMSWLISSRAKKKWLTKPKLNRGLEGVPMRGDQPYGFPYERSYGTPYAGGSEDSNMFVVNDTGIKSTPEENVYSDRMIPY